MPHFIPPILLLRMAVTLSLVAFDLDDTLAPSKSPLPTAMAEQLRALLQQLPVCVISGGHIGQFQNQLLDHLPASEAELEQLHLMPTCGTRYLRHHDGKWHTVYAHELSPEDRKHAIEIVESCARDLGLWEEQTWGDIIEDRGSQITFSALGQEAPLEAKRAWDPDGSKKIRLRDAVAVHLSHLSVRGGGSTSIDITQIGIDKAYGMNKLIEQTGISAENMLFIGDRLDEQGNDYPVISTGIPCQAVTGWEECVDVVAQLVSKLNQ